jgi:pimeloyl-ACP methyl ester carboxylesterase
MLNAQTYGLDSDTPPLLIAHGLYGSARNWGVIAKRLSDERKVIAVDMRNHGASDWADDHSYPALASDLAEVIPDRFDVLGHSMGGKAAMVLALNHPEKLRRLVVADIAPVTYNHSQLPMIEAMRSVDLSAIESRADADAQLANFVDDPGVRAFLLQSLDVQNRQWRLNLDALAREMPKIIGFPEVNGSFDKPALFLSGGDSDYVTADHRPAIKTLFPSARFAKIPGAGHWLHAEKPRDFEETVRVFLNA